MDWYNRFYAKEKWIKKSAEIANISEPTAYNYLKKRNIRRNKQNTKKIYWGKL